MAGSSSLPAPTKASALPFGGIWAALFGFVGAESDAPSNNYRKNFLDQVEDDAVRTELETRLNTNGKAEWRVHHRLQQNDAVADWLNKYDKTLVHDPKNLVAVPDFIHGEITKAQNAWWGEWKRKLGLKQSATIGDVIATGQVSLKDYLTMVETLDTKYRQFWLTAAQATEEGLDRVVQNVGKNVGKLAVNNLDDIFADATKSAFRSGSQKRFLEFAKAAKIGSIAGGLFFLLEKVSFAKNLNDSTVPGTLKQGAFDKLLRMYDNALMAKEANDGSFKRQMGLLSEALLEYLTAIEASNESKGIIMSKLELTIGALP